MTDAEAKLLADLAALEAAATPGPWERHSHGSIRPTDEAPIADCYSQIHQPLVRFEGDDRPQVAWVYPGYNREANADFIALCRTAVPVLLRVLMERQQKIVELLQWKQGKLTHLLDQQQARVADLQEAALEVERLMRLMWEQEEELKRLRG